MEVKEMLKTDAPAPAALHKGLAGAKHADMQLVEEASTQVLSKQQQKSFSSQLLKLMEALP